MGARLPQAPVGRHARQPVGFRPQREQDGSPFRMAGNGCVLTSHQLLKPRRTTLCEEQPGRVTGARMVPAPSGEIRPEEHPGANRSLAAVHADQNIDQYPFRATSVTHTAQFHVVLASRELRWSAGGLR